MLKIFFTFFIFCLVLFLYLHITYHLKTSNDLEIYEIEDTSKDKLEEICNLRQPVIFDFECLPILENTNKKNLLHHYHAFDVKIRNKDDDDKKTASSQQGQNEMFMPLKFDNAVKLFQEDEKSNYYSENNKDFLDETGVIKHLQYNDEFLRPAMVADCNYDVLFGSEKTTTPFRYDLCYRNFILVTQGAVKIKLSPPKNSKYLHTVYDYENYEFSAMVDVWNPQPQYKADFDKMKCLDVILPYGKTIFIPPYWWYSIEFQKEASISVFKYRTYMNHLAILPHTCLYLLQNQNVKRNIAQKAKIIKASEETIQNYEEASPNAEEINNNSEETTQNLEKAAKSKYKNNSKKKMI